MEFTTQFELQSQTTRLIENVSQSTGSRVTNGVLTLYDAVFQQTHTRSSAENTSRDYNSDSKAARLQSCRFDLVLYFGLEVMAGMSKDTGEIVW